MMRITYIVLGAASLGLLFLDAPGGAILTTAPERGKIEAGPEHSGSGSPSARRTFLFVGGGFHGGK
jgi:hypothetical protein